MVNNSSTTVFYFNYESPVCDGNGGNPNYSISGATLLSTGDTLETMQNPDVDSIDFALLELSLAPPDSFLPYFAGWSRSTNLPSSTATIHHPSADVKKISVDNDPPGSGVLEPELSYTKSLVAGSFWRVLEWDAGTTEGGSSGCPLFNQNQHIVGTLTGGQAICGNPINDDFTRFDYAWDYYPDSIRQLKYWLDPGNTGVTSLNGFDPLVGIEDNEPGSSYLNLFPNPVRDRLTIEIGDPAPKNARISIYNVAGVLVSRFNGEIRHRTVVQVGELPSGIYFLQLRADDILASGRFIIHR